jgi:hypothetical protein
MTDLETFIQDNEQAFTLSTELINDEYVVTVTDGQDVYVCTTIYDTAGRFARQLIDDIIIAQRATED